MSESIRCPKCGGEFVQGGLLEDSSIKWGMMSETKVLGMKAVKMSGPYFTVYAFRCQQCSYVELYAPKQEGK